MKRCAFCRGPNDRNVGARYCWECDAAIAPIMNEAYLALRRAIRSGELAKASTSECADCGESADRYDHRDYFKPLDVDPVCRSCNQLRGSAITFTHQVAHFRV